MRSSTTIPVVGAAATAEEALVAEVVLVLSKRSRRAGEARADADAEDTAGPRSEALPDAEAATE